MKKLILSLFFGALGFCAAAESPVFSGRAEFDSRYIWRGMEWSASPTLHPELNMEWGNFNANIWSARSIDESYSEIDVTLSYTLGDFTLNLCDMYYPSPALESDCYFNWNKGETFHQLEFSVNYEPENLPIRALWSTFVAGEDYKYTDEGDAKRAFSSYAQVDWYHPLGETSEISVFAAASILPGMYTDYTEDFSIVNLGVKYEKIFTVKDVTIPVSSAYIINPWLEKGFLTFTAAIEF